MFSHYRTQGIIIKKTNRGEANQLLTFYTKNFGKLEILGKAIRKIKSKLRAGAELFYLSEIEFIQGKTKKTLIDAILIENYPNIRKNLKRFRIAYQIVEILDNLVVKEEKDEKIWQLLKEALEKLNSLKKMSAVYTEEIIYYYFFWNLISILGYQPEFHNCFVLGKKINGDIVKILKVILKRDWQILLRLKLEPIHQKLLKNISEWYNKKIIL